MTEETKEPAADANAAAAPKSKKGGAIVGALLTAIVAGGASFGGAKIAGGKAAHAAPVHSAEPAAPGPTLQLEAFLVNVNDEAKKPHAMKVTVAVEFAAKTKEEALKPLIPRLRDAAITQLRATSFAEASAPTHAEKMKTDLLEAFKHAGAAGAEKVLVTDLVLQ